LQPLLKINNPAITGIRDNESDFFFI